MSDDAAESRRIVEQLSAHVSQLEAEMREVSARSRRAQEASDRAVSRLAFRRARARVVFLVHNRTAIGALEELIALMQQAEDFDPIVVSIPHHYGGKTGPKGEKRLHRSLAAQGVPHLRIRKRDLGSATELLLALDPDIIFRQSQWEADIDAAFATDELRWARLAIIPYETMNTTVNVPWGHPPINSAVDQSLHRAAWLAFCANDISLRIAEHDSLTGARQFRAVGHPKRDALEGVEPKWPLGGTEPPTVDRAPRILWSAHHSILSGWNDFGTFPAVMGEMLEWAKDDASSEFVFMHHPHLRSTMTDAASAVSPEDFEIWLSQWTSLPNTAYWRGDYAPVLAASDVVITDGPSMMLESQILTKPVVFLERHDHIDFNEIGRIAVGGTHPVHDVASARSTCCALLTEGDPLATTQRRNVDRLFGQPGAAQRILDVVRTEIAREAPRSLT